MAKEEKIITGNRRKIQHFCNKISESFPHEIKMWDKKTRFLWNFLHFEINFICVWISKENLLCQYNQWVVSQCNRFSKKFYVKCVRELFIHQMNLSTITHTSFMSIAWLGVKQRCIGKSRTGLFTPFGSMKTLWIKWRCVWKHQAGYQLTM